jgi:hypothetical protein
VLGDGISAYGWVIILLYYLWLNEHTHFTNNLLRYACLMNPKTIYASCVFSKGRLVCSLIFGLNMMRNLHRLHNICRMS